MNFSSLMGFFVSNYVPVWIGTVILSGSCFFSRSRWMKVIFCFIWPSLLAIAGATIPAWDRWRFYADY